MTGDSEAENRYPMYKLLIFLKENPRKTEEIKVIIEKTLLSQRKFRVYRWKLLKKHYLSSGGIIVYIFFEKYYLRILFYIYTTVSSRWIKEY